MSFQALRKGQFQEMPGVSGNRPWDFSEGVSQLASRQSSFKLRSIFQFLIDGENWIGLHWQEDLSRRKAKAQNRIRRETIIRLEYGRKNKYAMKDGT